MKCNIKCHALCLNDNKELIRMWEITPEGRVWPCCNYANEWDMRLHHIDDHHGDKLLLDDKKIMDVMNNTSTWNDLEHHTLEEIISHELYQEYIFTSGWNSDNPPPVCVANCGDID